MLRPKKPPPKAKNVQVRFSREQYVELVQAAHLLGVQVAVFCRIAVMSAIKRPEENRLRGNTVKSQPLTRSSDGGGEKSKWRIQTRVVARRVRGNASGARTDAALAAAWTRAARSTGT